MRLVRSILAIYLCALISFGEAQRSRGCGLDKFRCKNGECINSEFLCDGKPNCRDESDETQEECTKSGIVCSQYAFRCAYGACIDGDLTCNGIKDCIDNSDETLARCSQPISNASVTTQCSPRQYKCKDNQCIDESLICDGQADCRDGSDETELLCGSIGCPQVVFRCNYGACIDGDLKCNGVINCVDGSDEDPLLCTNSITLTSSTSKPVTPTRTPYPTPTPTRASTPTPTPIPTPTPTPWLPRSSCIAPPQPANGRRQLHKSQCPNSNCEVQEGTQLYIGTYLIYTCNRGYRLEGFEHVFCGPDGKWLNIPKCVEIRCKGLRSVSTEATCTFNNNWTSCDSGILPGTTADLSCRVPSYREDTAQILTQSKHVRCNESGEWEPEPIRCVPECGVINPNYGPLIVHGTRPKVPEFPWHATLYRAETPNSQKEFICGATIIQENLLLTAAHCVYDDTTQALQKAEKFFVATGNIFRDYDSPFHSEIVKKRQIKNIYIACNYIGYNGNYAWDIAILQISEPFLFTATLVPACLSLEGDQSVLEHGNSGKVAGFGRTEMGEFSGILQSLTVPYVPINQCKSSITSTETEKLITLDKFCAGYTNGSSVCDGDSGGGLVFNSGGLWYIRGIVSVSPGVSIVNEQRVCDSHIYSLYTRVSSHIGWIKSVVLRLGTYGSYPACPERQYGKSGIE